MGIIQWNYRYTHNPWSFDNVTVFVIILLGFLCTLVPKVYAGGDCGAEGDWRSSMIPDRWPPPKVKQHSPISLGKIKVVGVYKACRAHDRCYETNGVERVTCDSKFLHDINSECEKVYSAMLEIPLREACLLAAKGYYKAVSDHGAGAFAEAQKQAGVANSKIRKVTSPQGAKIKKSNKEPVSKRKSMSVPEEKKVVLEAGLLFLNSDFERGDFTNWATSGNAFEYQPTRGDNVRARRKGYSSEHQGEYWVGTYEKYRGSTGEKPGGRQGDKPTGILRSEPFSITGNSIGFLIGGGRQMKKLRVVLIVNDLPVKKTTGSNSETMNRVTWDVREYAGKTAIIEVHDNAAGGWGHINVDDFRYW